MSWSCAEAGEFLAGQRSETDEGGDILHIRACPGW